MNRYEHTMDNFKVLISYNYFDACDRSTHKQTKLLPSIRLAVSL